MRKQSFQSIHDDETLTCPTCGSASISGSAFCDTCGNRLARTTKRDSRTEDVPMIALGCASTIQGQKREKDSFVVLDINSSFVSRQQRIVLFVVLKGLEHKMAASTVVEDLLHEMPLEKPFSHCVAQLSLLDKQLSRRLLEAEIGESTDTKLTENSFSDRTVVGSRSWSSLPSRGYLVSVLHGKLLVATSKGSPVCYVLDEKRFVEPQKGSSENPSLSPLIMKDGNYVCMCSSDLSVLFGTERLRETIFGAEDMQEASEKLVKMALEKRPDDDFSVAVARVMKV